MVSHLVFYQLMLIALLWVFLMLSCVWPSEPAAARPIPPTWTWPHDRGHMWEEISPHLSRYEVGLEPACSHAMLRLTLSRHSA